MVLLVGQRGPGHRARIAGPPPAGGGGEGPEPFELGAVGSAALGATYASAVIAVSGLSAPASVSVTGGQYAVNGGGWTAGTGSVSNGDTVQARGVASGAVSTTRNVALTIGGVSDTFAITTVDEAETSALVLRFTTDPGEARRGLIDGCIGALKAAGVWARLDALYMTAAHDAQAAQRNWIQDAFNIAPAGAPTFTADRGYAGDGTSAYLDTGFNDLTGSALWSQDAMAIGVYVNDWSGGSNYAAGQLGSANIRLGATASAINTRAHSGSFNVNFANALPGHVVVVRDGALSLRCFRNGVQVGTSTLLSSSTPVSSNIVAFRSMSSYNADRVACLHLGGALTPTEGADFYAAVLAYLTALGAN